MARQSRPENFSACKARLLEQFDGLTFFPQPNEEYWTLGGVTYRDQIVIYRVLSGKVRSARRETRKGVSHVSVNFSYFLSGYSRSI
jgi:hypothetical protein